MKCKMKVLQVVNTFDVENSVASLLGFDKQKNVQEVSILQIKLLIKWVSILSTYIAMYHPVI